MVLAVLVAGALAVAGFFLLGGDADVDVRDPGGVDVEAPDIDADVEAPDVDVDEEDTPDVDVDEGETPDVDVEGGEAPDVEVEGEG